MAGQRSGLFNAGSILLLIGAILQVVGAVFLVGFGIFFVVLSGIIEDSGDESPVPAVIAAVYIGLGFLSALGSVFGFLGYRDSQRGDAHGAWVKSLVSALVPPLQVVNLIGAILCLVSPEGEAAKRARAVPAQPL